MQLLRRFFFPFHALTGCDTTSYLSGHSKKTALRTFFKHSDLLQCLGQEPLTADTISNAETFVCKIYNAPNASTTDIARAAFFRKALRPDILPPTSDAAPFHIRRSHYQSLIWCQASVAKPVLPLITTMGWEHIDGNIKPVLSSLPPVPASCLELISCGCGTKCSTRRASAENQACVVLVFANVQVTA